MAGRDSRAGRPHRRGRRPPRVPGHGTAELGRHPRLITLPYPTRTGPWRAAWTPSPFLTITHRMLVVRWRDSDGTPRILLFEPSDAELHRRTCAAGWAPPPRRPTSLGPPAPALFLVPNQLRKADRTRRQDCEARL